MTPDDRFRRYQDLQRYVGWADADARNVGSVAGLLDPHLGRRVDDFYEEIERHPDARKVITGGAAQVARLKGTLVEWLRELLAGPYDAAYVERRWRVGWRHVEIGLDQVYTNAALSRLRKGLLRALADARAGEPRDLLPVRQSLDTLLDLDLAIIEDAYQAEYLARRERAERLAAIGQVGAGVAHELRNPLNVIKTSVYYLLNAKNPTPEKTAEHLRRIERHVASAGGVITALSNFARMPVPDLKPVHGAVVSAAVARRRITRIDAAEAEAAGPGPKRKEYSTYVHSAIFAEVQVDEDFGTARVTRVVSAVAGGRVLNPKAARSQVLGRIVWGIGTALEESVLDHALGRFVNHNLAEYHVPVNADVHDVGVIFVGEHDEVVNPLGAKGLGEIGVVGVAAAIANAVYHATGVRVRELPITLDKVLG